MIKKFRELGRTDAEIAGGKGASLGEMTRIGVPVPDGFVILAEAFDAFLEANGFKESIRSILSKVNREDITTIEVASKQIGALVLSGEIPANLTQRILSDFAELHSEYVAVRSSATAEDGMEHAWAGQLESFLNTTKDALLENVKRCFASLFTPRAIFYRFEKQLDQAKISVAVVVQKMVQSDVSGVAFSVHPVSGNSHEVLIEAGYGLGEAIVSGQVIPDSYTVRKETSQIIEKNIARQERGIFRERHATLWKEIPISQQYEQKLTDAQIEELARLVTKIEVHYQFPCDVEWAYEKGRPYVTQSRPITTLGKIDTKILEFVPRPSDYVKFTQAKGVTPLFFAFGFLMHIKDLQGLVFYHGETGLFKTFIAKRKLASTLAEGKLLYKEDAFIHALETRLKSAYGEATSAYEALLQEVSPRSYAAYLDALEVFSALYRQTEFFYTDEANITRNNELEKRFEAAKLLGRSLLNKVIYDEKSLQQSVLHMFADQFDIPVEDMRWYSVPEIFACFDGARLDATALEQRKTCFLIYSDEAEKPHILAGAQAQKISEYFEASSSSDLMSGQIAYPGEVTGNAFVLEVGFGNLGEIIKLSKTMKDGDILVSDSTIPEIISLCNKASAILTNQGGVMSHAAIVARELKKPCIVGLGNITEKVKTGQRIKVDANLGYVTPL